MLRYKHEKFLNYLTSVYESELASKISVPNLNTALWNRYVKKLPSSFLDLFFPCQEESDVADKIKFDWTIRTEISKECDDYDYAKDF